MAEFVITTTDSAYTFTLADNEGGSPTANILFEIQNNNVIADTQGYLRKTQKGFNRVRATVDFEVNSDNYGTLLSMLVYPSNVNAQFDRTIPGKGNDTLEMTFEKMERIKAELSGNIYTVKLTLTEVLS